jgi:O-antigen ligase
MRFVHSISSSFLDFIENTQLGATVFRVARIGILALGILVIGRFASAQFLSFGFSDILFMVVTALAFLLIFWHWEIGIVLVLCTTSFIFYYDYLPTLSLYHFVPEIPILEPLRLQIGQGIMLYLLVLYAASLEVRTLRERLATPLAPAVFVFLLVVVFAAIAGVVYKGVRLPQMVENSRMFSYYVMFFVTLLCIRSRRQFKLLLVAGYIMALVVSILMCVQFAAGERFKVFLGSNIRVESFGSHAGRILPPGSDLIWLAIPFVIAQTATASPRVRRAMLVSLGLLLGGLLLTFTRTVWISTLVSMILIAILGRGEIRRGTVHMFGATIGFVLFLFMILSLVSTAQESYVAPYVNRFTSIFHPESYGETTSAGARLVEMREAWPHVAQSPWLGIGVGAYYRETEDWDDLAQIHYMRPVSYMHNGYMYLLTDTGILGLVTCMIMYVLFFIRARKIYYLLDRPEEQGIVLACIASVASVMIGAIMQPTFAASHDTPMVGVMFGLVELLRYFHTRESAQAHGSAGAVPPDARRMRLAAGSRVG